MNNQPPILTFDGFFNSYPKPTNYADAELAWRKLNPGPALQREIRNALEWQARDWTKRETQYIPSPASYLIKQRWKDKPMGWFKRTFNKPQQPIEDKRPQLPALLADIAARPEVYRKGLQYMGTLGTKVFSKEVLAKIHSQEVIPALQHDDQSCPW